MIFSRPYPKWLIWGAQALLILVIYLAVRGSQQRQLVAGPAPSVQIYTLSGQQLSLRDFCDKPVLLHFWATWCPICRLEEGTIDTIARDWPVLSIAYLSGSESELRASMKGRGLDFTVAADENGSLSDSRQIWRHGRTGQFYYRQQGPHSVQGKGDSLPPPVCG